jgi:indolepyruvate ferredoxin oxidoreductase
MGDAIAANLFLLGFAWQRAMIPVSHASLMKAIELNAVAVEMNKKAFLWGRRAAHDLAAVQRFVHPAQPIALHPLTLDQIVEKRVAFLTDYQDAAYAERYRRLVARVQAAEAPFGITRLTEAVARNYFKLLAYKDEYEVARLYTQPAFWQQLEDTFEGDYEVRFHLAPPLVSRIDPVTGRIPKRSYGPGMMRIFRLLARLKRLRGSRWDVFARTEERRQERELIARYESDINEILNTLSFLRHKLALEIANWPDTIRGYGHVKAANAARVATERDRLLIQWRMPEPVSPAPREAA